jgi:DNA mismatch endonuclease, patch repair protein
MPDVFSTAKRSEVMARIRGSGNKSTELQMVLLFRLHGITGWRRNSQLFGRPDFVFPKIKLAIFIDGDFWHGHPTRSRIPATRREFWLEKIARNRARDRLVTRTLKARGWSVLRIWEFALRPKHQARTLRRIALALLESADHSRNSAKIPPS